MFDDYKWQQSIDPDLCPRGSWRIRTWAEVGAARRRYAAAAERGEVAMMVRLAWLLRHFYRDLDAELWLRAAAEAGESMAMLLLGELLVPVWWVEPDPDLYRTNTYLSSGSRRSSDPWPGEAGEWLLRSAEHLNQWAILTLARQNGAISDERMEELLLRGAEAGHARVAYRLSDRMWRGSEEGPVGAAGRAEALRWARRAAEGGDRDAMMNLACWLPTTGSREEVRPEVLHWLTVAAEVGHDTAPWRLAEELWADGDLAGAERYFGKYLRRFPDSETVVENLALVLLGRDRDASFSQLRDKLAEIWEDEDPYYVDELLYGAETVWARARANARSGRGRA